MTAPLLLLLFSVRARAAVATPPDFRPDAPAELASPAAAGDESPYDLKTRPPSKADLSLLTSARYELKGDGTLWAPGAEAPVTKAQFPYVIQKLEGARRLQALIAIDMIYQRSNGGEALLPEDREALRKIVRENWRLFSIKTRRDFKRYFSPEEAAALQSQNAPAAAPFPAEPPAAVAPASRAPEPQSAPATINAIMPAVLEPLGLVQTASQPPPVPEPPKVSSAPAPISISSDSVKPLQPQAPAVSTPPVVAEPPKPAEIAPVLPLPPGWETREGFESFLKGAPYTDEVKGLLRLISQRAPEFARGRALKLVVSRLPEIAVDGSRAGAFLRGRTLLPPGAAILNPGLIIYPHKSLFFGSEEALVGESPETYQPLHFGPPPQALDRERMPKRRETSPWGETEYFEDGSARAAFSAPERAGILLHELLVLDQRLDNPKASPYLMGLYARTAQFMFYALLRPSNNGDKFLDQEERAAFREWLAHPQEARDHFVHSFFAGTRTALEDEALAAAGRPSPLLQELLSLERKFRQETPLEEK